MSAVTPEQEAEIRRIVHKEFVALLASPKSDMPSDLAEAIEQSQFSQDDLLTATFSLLAGLTEHITGKRVSVSLRNKYGKCMPIGADPERVRLL